MKRPFLLLDIAFVIGIILILAACKSNTTTTSSTTTITTSTLPVNAPPQPASHTGYSSCLSCHQTGRAGAPMVPSNHAGFTDDKCSSCHSLP